VFFIGVPVVSLVPRSTTGYKLESLRDEELGRRCGHKPSGRMGIQGNELARMLDPNEVVLVSSEEGSILVFIPLSTIPLSYCF